MFDDLLAAARQQLHDADLSVRAAALLRIARVESAADTSRAGETLRQGLDQVTRLPDPNREYLLEEAVLVAAAVAPEFLPQISTRRSGIHEQIIGVRILEVMLEHSHVDAAFDYLLHYDDPATFPFSSIGNVLHHFPSDVLGNVDRRLKIVRRSVDMWRRIPSTFNGHQRRQFVTQFGYFWKELPADEALAVVHELVQRALKEPDSDTSASYRDEIRFSSSREHLLFKILHILRHLDRDLAQSLVESHEQLAVAASRFSYGVETMHEEAYAEAVRRKMTDATCEPGYILMGDPDEFDEQRRLIEATRRGEFGPAVDDALKKYRQDSSSASFNYAPKEFWPSTGQFRVVFHRAGKRIGSAAVTLLDQIPDRDLRLFATIELAAGLAQVPEPLVTKRTQPNPPETLRRQEWANARCSLAPRPAASNTTPMRAGDGRLIGCPKCRFRPTTDVCWTCKCSHVWNTFSTSGQCPECGFQWEVTQCPACGETSPHCDWYVAAE